VADGSAIATDAPAIAADGSAVATDASVARAGASANARDACVTSVGGSVGIVDASPATSGAFVGVADASLAMSGAFVGVADASPSLDRAYVAEGVAALFPSPVAHRSEQARRALRRAARCYRRCVTVPVRQVYSFDEYVDLDARSPVKHEFLDGLVWAMAGGSPEHAAIAASIIAALGERLRGRPCRVFSSDLRIRVRAMGLATYPDVTVVRGKLDLDADDRKAQTVTNPRVVVEVLSPSTEVYDRGEKLAHYKRVDSLEDVVLVAHDRRRIEVWHREADGWSLNIAREGEAATLASIDCKLAVDEVYTNPLAD
jgi:Uma2 family endonuclease